MLKSPLCPKGCGTGLDDTESIGVSLVRVGIVVEWPPWDAGSRPAVRQALPKVTSSVMASVWRIGFWPSGSRSSSGCI
ncbi:protein of unknown function [Serratia sp. Tan611]|nr:protein of unknown function [Serratia sp. Tan611]